MASQKVSSGHNVIIIGAGYGGLIAAIKLKTGLRFDNFEARIVEKAPDIGGVWRTNVYPGAASDIQSHLYSLSSDLNPNWNAVYAEQPEILEYMQGLVAKHRLRPYISFNMQVLDVVWNQEGQHYIVTVEDTKTGKQATKTATIVIAAVGFFHTVKWPSIPGLELFQGPVMHTSTWDPSVQVEGKRIAVIGHGSSACQLMPHLAKAAGVKVTQFIRGKNWFVPTSPVQTISKFVKALFAKIPVLNCLFRLKAYLECEINYWKVFRFATLRSMAQKDLLQYIKRAAPSKYHSLLIPDYELGNKRLVFDWGYLECLHRPNVTALPSDIQKVVEDGVIMEDGQKLAFDVIVCATGFITHHYPVPVRGSRCTLSEYEEKHEGPAAYLGTLIPSFPNLCVIGGPNIASGHASLLFAYETQADYMLKVIKPVIEGEITSFEVSHVATSAYNRTIQKELNDPRRPFRSSTPNAWYRYDGHGRNVTIFPGSTLRFWLWLSRVNWYHFNVRGATRAWTAMKMKQQSRKDKKMAFGVLIVLASAWGVWNYAFSSGK